MRYANTITKRTACVVLSAGLALASAAGCHSSPKRAATIDPPIGSSVEPGAKVVDGPLGGPAPTVSWMDRHPIFTRPREYYDSTRSDNKAVKAVAATVIGVPAGLFSEIRQIVTGTPSEPRY